MVFNYTILQIKTQYFMEILLNSLLRNFIFDYIDALFTDKCTPIMLIGVLNICK